METFSYRFWMASARRRRVFVRCNCNSWDWRNLPVSRGVLTSTERGMLVAPPRHVIRNRPTWIRGLRLFEGSLDAVAPLTLTAELDGLGDERVHARSRFRSLDSPDRYALYSMHDTESRMPGQRRGPLAGIAPGDHTLTVVREFRRVPLRASALALTIFTARSGAEAAVVAALAHFVERAVSTYQPTYLLLARSVEP